MGKRRASLLLDESEDESRALSDDSLTDEYNLGSEKGEKSRGDQEVTRKTKKREEAGVLGEIDGNKPRLGKGTLSVRRDMSSLGAISSRSGVGLGELVQDSLEAGAASSNPLSSANIPFMAKQEMEIF